VPRSVPPESWGNAVVAPGAHGELPEAAVGPLFRRRRLLKTALHPAHLGAGQVEEADLAHHQDAVAGAQRHPELGGVVGLSGHAVGHRRPQEQVYVLALPRRDDLIALA